jgi:glycosyltransferase involved in cell wall biosynthesis
LRRVRALQLTSSFPRYDGDVSGLFIRDVCETLAGAGVEVHVVAPHDAGAARREELGRLHVRRFKYAPEALETLAHRGGLLAAVRSKKRLPLVPAFMAAYLWSAWREARRVRPDLLHAHWWFPGGFVGTFVSKLTGIPLVVTLHGSDVHIAETFLGPVARWVLKRAAVVATVSEALRATAIERFGLDPERVDVLRMPILMPDAAEGEPPPAPPFKLVAIGRMAEEKGFDVLVEAIDGLDADLDVFGVGTEVLTSERVRGHGAKPREEIAVALAHAHALVVPSRREGLGIVALEAMAVGRPVIASGVGGLVETVADGVDGILVPADDPAALAAAIRRLPLPPPGAAAVARHRPDEVAARHVAAYERAVSAPRP